MANDAGAAQELVAQRVDAAEQEQRAPFRGAGSWPCRESDLEVGDQVVGQDREDLPGAVGGKAAGRHDVECEAVLELSEHLLVSAAPRHELPQRPETERLVGGDGGVLPMSVVGIKQIELKVLGTHMLHAATIDRDPQRPVLPSRDRDHGLERLEVGGDAGPAPLPLDQGLESQPRVEGDLDRVLGARPEPGHDFRPEKRAVEPHLDFELPAQKALDLSKQIAQEGQRGLAIVDVAGAVPYPHQVPGLSEIGRDRVVARHLPMMRVVPRKARSTVSPVDTTVPSTSSVMRFSFNRWTTSAINSPLSACNPARTPPTQRLSQRLRVRSPGKRASPQKRWMTGSPTR